MIKQQTQNQIATMEITTKAIVEEEKNMEHPAEVIQRLENGPEPVTVQKVEEEKQKMQEEITTLRTKIVTAQSNIEETK